LGNSKSRKTQEISKARKIQIVFFYLKFSRYF
jgi:hypothetical protein